MGSMETGLLLAIFFLITEVAGSYSSNPRQSSYIKDDEEEHGSKHPRGMAASSRYSWGDVTVKRANRDTSSSSNLKHVNFKTLRVKRSHFTIAPGLLFGNNTNTDEKQLVAKLRLFHHQRLQRAW